MASGSEIKANDMKAAESTYGSFLGMVKWGSIACAIVAAFVIFLIA